jgi:hypothetical protein
MPFVKAIYEWKGRAALVDSYYRFSGLSVTFGELGIRFKLTIGIRRVLNIEDWVLEFADYLLDLAG